MREWSVTASEQDPSDEQSGGNQEPDYAFEGFTVESSEKVMLTPLASLGGGSQVVAAGAAPA